VIRARRAIRRLSEIVKRLSPAEYALVGGLVAFATDTAGSLIQGKSAGVAIGIGLVFALGTSAACALLARRHRQLRS